MHPPAKNKQTKKKTREISTALYFIYYTIWQHFNLEVCPFLPYSRTSAFTHGPCSSGRCSCSHIPALPHWCIQKESHSRPQGFNHKVQLLFFFPPSLNLSHFLLQQSKHLYAKLTFLPRWPSLSISPSLRGPACQWAAPVSSTVCRAMP